jgi:hypothetical protein
MVLSKTIFLLLSEIIPTFALITRQSRHDSKLEFTLPWKCRDPTIEEAAAMTANGNPNFGVSSSFDPIGRSNGCMPDATCVNGVSSWTNVFQ